MRIREVAYGRKTYWLSLSSVMVMAVIQRWPFFTAPRSYPLAD
jgi:hypothetical protein